MKLKDIEAGTFFPGRVVTTKFGWDPDKRFGPRIHHAVDYAHEKSGMTFVPFNAMRVEFINKDSQGNSVLRLMSPNLELRLFHYRREELSLEILQATRLKLGIRSGSPLAPPGDVGIGSGRHVHAQLVLTPGVFEGELDFMKPGWNESVYDQYEELYGDAFVKEFAKRRCGWISSCALSRIDPYAQAERILIDTETILGM